MPKPPCPHGRDRNAPMGMGNCEVCARDEERARCIRIFERMMPDSTRYHSLFREMINDPNEP